MKPFFLFSLLTYFITLMTFSASSYAQTVKGFNLTEMEGFEFDASLSGEKTSAQIVVDEAKRLGSNHIVLNVRGKMIGPFSNDIVPVTSTGPVSQEAAKMVKLIRYIKSQGMSVGIRPIFFVVGPNGEFPYVSSIEDGTLKTWWHGNIRPQNPHLWFESFQRFLDRYLTMAKLGKVEEFTLGAELYSMTVGIEDQWVEHPHGFPGNWNRLLKYVRSKLGANVRLMYDINFTDATDLSTQLGKSGGELERWRYRLVDLADPSDPQEYQIWQDLVEFWNGLDAIGIDMYRSLAFKNEDLPKDKEQLQLLLNKRARAYGDQLDLIALEISVVTGTNRPFIFKEVGFRSVDNAFIEPFTYSTANGLLNHLHQAMGYQALFEGLWLPGYEWFQGIVFWDLSTNPKLHGPNDRGFSPIGKQSTESVIIHFFNN